VTWWTDSTQYLSLECLYYSGEIAELCRRVPILLADAQARGDLYAATNFRLGLPHTTWLFNDDLDGARRHAVESMASWPSTDFYIQHEAEQVAQVNTSLYVGDGAAAHRRMTEVWPAYTRSAIFTVQLARVAAFHERARAALGAAVELPAGAPARRALVAEARHAAKRLVREGIPWSKGLAALARAGACAAEGDRDGARAELDGAMVALDACEMKLYAALARLRWGELVGGGEGRALVEVATAWMRDQAIRRPDRIAAMLAPGF
jgi:eukaryotic-like serine/threonine-protein kinase